MIGNETTLRAEHVTVQFICVYIYIMYPDTVFILSVTFIVVSGIIFGFCLRFQVRLKSFSLAC